MFQSTYLYKVRPGAGVCFFLKVILNPRTYIRYDHRDYGLTIIGLSFNPRTYIRYDVNDTKASIEGVFQSTYLYKVRRLTMQRKSI